MQLHEIHDLSDSVIIDILRSGMSAVTDPDMIKNYHPDYSDCAGNLFKILNDGRYQKSKGTYYVLEDNGEFLGSAGWNEYELDSTIALALTRAYTKPEARRDYNISKYFLPNIISSTVNYKHLYITANSYNSQIYQWFSRGYNKPRMSTDSRFEVYKRFKPIGKQTIYYTEQYVIEYQRDLEPT